MPTHSDIDLNKPFYDAETPAAPAGEVNQGRKQWSMTTLYAARPTSRFATRAIAEAWNNRYAGNEKLQVNPADYPETIPDISPEEAEANYGRLRQLSAEKPNLKIVDPWD
jgi:hypothetical protein